MNRQHKGDIRGVRTLRRQGWSGCFTLIELLVVVAAIAIVSAILLPIFLQAADAARKSANRQLASQPEHPLPESSPTPLPDPLPTLDSVVLEMALTSSYHRIGMDVFTRFQVDCTGQIVFRRPDGVRKDHVGLFIPFPANTLEARDVQLTIRRPDSSVPVTLTDVSYTRSGISCTCPIAPKEALTADVRFTALGREQFDYTLPPARQLHSVNITLNLSGTEAHTIPDDALQPTASGPDQIRWEFKNLVSDRQITVLIPGAEAPLARVLLLLRMVALGVLLFGAGFWYLSEQSEPGRLDSFRLGHFLLLALTYSLFFVIFAVLGFHGKLSTPISMLLSIACSLPLLIFHVSRVLDFRFALTRVAPLALFTIGLVVNGVYGGDVRDYVFLVAVIFALAYVTLSYPAWADGRERARANAQADLATRVHGLTDRVRIDLKRAMSELSGEDARADMYLRETGTQDPAAHVRLQKAQEPVKELIQAYEDLTKNLPHLPSTPDWEANSYCVEFERKLDIFQRRIAPSLANLQAEIAAFEATRKPLETLKIPHSLGEVHCLACGLRVADAPFCQKCGTPQPRRLSCGECGEKIVLPIHLLAPNQSIPRLCCPHCGTAFPHL